MKIVVKNGVIVLILCFMTENWDFKEKSNNANIQFNNFIIYKFQNRAIQYQG